MRQASLCWLPLAAALELMACEGREITVFDLPMPGGAAGSGGAGSAAAIDAAGGVAVQAGSSSGGAAGEATVIAAGGVTSSAGAAGLAGAGGMPGTACTLDEQCSPGWRCEKQGCMTEQGLCEPQPVFCEPDPLPVCGCDGVTYWNDCIRRQAGVRVDVVGECRATACACEVGADCEVPYASCSHLVVGDMCGHGMGSCWVLPPQCMPSRDAKMWQECKPPIAGVPPPPCVDTCLAIRSEHPHVQPHHDNTCQ